MCGRFARYQPLSAWLEPLGPAHASDLSGQSAPPRYNIAPGTRTWIAMLGDDNKPAVAECLWRFPTSRGNRLNVRVETVHRVPEYQRFFDRQRCLVFANGFYEPQGRETARNRPWYFFRPRGESPLFFAGIVKSEGFSILTAAAAGPVSAVHGRSPVLIAPEHVRAWLDPELPGRTAWQQCASACLGEALEGRQVSDAAKNPANEGAELINETQRNLF